VSQSTGTTGLTGLTSAGVSQTTGTTGVTALTTAGVGSATTAAGLTTFVPTTTVPVFAFGPFGDPGPVIAAPALGGPPFVPGVRYAIPV
jgi:hypothetical protein